MSIYDTLISGSYYFSFAAIIFMIMFLAFSFINNDGYKKTRNMIRYTGIFALIGCLAELICSVALNTSVFALNVRQFLSLLNLSTMFLCSMYFNRYTMICLTKDSDERIINIYEKITVVIVIIFHIILLGDLKFHYIVIFGENETIDGPLMGVMAYGGPLFYLVLGIVEIIVFRKNLDKREFYSLTVTHISVIMGAVLQGLTNDRILLVSFFITIGLYIIYSFLEAPDYHRLLETNKKLADAERRANAANKAKSDFLSSMSHEIRTPMNAVLGMNELTRMTLTDSKLNEEKKIEKALEYSDSIKESGEALLYVINGILDVSKVESGKMDLVNSPYHFMDLLNEIKGTFSIAAQKKGLAFETKIDESLPGYVKGDRVRVRQVIVNLVNNAIKYTREGSVKLKVDGSINDGNVVYKVAVSDTGIGIKEENLGSLFHAFERIDNDETHFIEGTGLGLSIVKELLAMMGGSVEVESTYGQGSTFTMYIPQEILSEEKISDYVQAGPEEVEEKKEFSIRGHRMLVIDDNITNIAVAKSFLERMHASVDTAASGTEGLSMIEKEAYDIIFLDHMMPGMSGDEVLRNVREDKDKYAVNKDTPIIAMTANAIEGQKNIYINEMGFDDYISKPFRYANLEEMVSKYVDAVEEEVSNEGGIEAMPDNKNNEEINNNEGDPAAIDKATGILLCENEEIYDAVVAAYLSEVDFTCEIMNEAFENEDWATYRTMVHKLKSSSKTVGANAFSEFSLQMESSAKAIIAGEDVEKSKEYIKSNYERYCDIYNKVCDNLRAQG